MRPCEICGSRRWRKAPNGLVSCEEGHILQNYRQEESNMDEPSQFALTKRTIRRERAGGSGKRKRVRRLEGEAQRLQRLEVLQLLLRCQVQAVQRLWEIGDELERVVRDLWILVLEDEERAHAASTSTGETPSATKPDTQRSQGSRPESSTSDSDSQSTSGSQESTSSPSSTDTDTDSSTIPQDILDKLSSSPPSSPTHNDNILPPPPVRRPGRKRLPNAWRHGTTRSRITATTVLRILVLGLWMIRVPVMVVDVIREVERGGIPYLSWRVEGMRGGWRGGMARVSQEVKRPSDE
jgi:RNA polymerase I-specific transcription initiation factor RRN7